MNIIHHNSPIFVKTSLEIMKTVHPFTVSKLFQFSPINIDVS